MAIFTFARMQDGLRAIHQCQSSTMLLMLIIIYVYCSIRDGSRIPRVLELEVELET